MSKGRETQAVVCPYFVRFSPSGIVCEGLYEGSVIEQRFGKSADRAKHIRCYCNSAGYAACPIAASFEKYYAGVRTSAADVLISADKSVRAHLRLPKSTAYPFVFGTVRELILPTERIYDDLVAAESSGGRAYRVGFRAFGEENEVVLICTVRRGYVDKLKGGTAGVHYWIIERV